jgi:uncharacterized repeat protein (TIGR01451 family)
MRRIAMTLTVLALVAGAFGCSSDAPTPPKAGPGPNPNGPSALQIRLFTSDPNPSAGTCTLIQAIVSLNGNPVPDGTGVAFSTDFGVFAQNGLPLISVTTQNGAAVTALCSEFPGAAVVRASATSGGQTGSATITIVFQPAASGAGPFVSFCDPSFGPSTGGTALTLHGGRFCPTSGCTGNEAATTRVSFIVNGISREATVTSVGPDAIAVLTPGFPEVTSPTTPVEIRVTLNNNTATPTVLSLPNCFAFGTTLPTTPTITAVLPASGTNEGETRVTIIGSGFRSPVQVFFGEVEATIVSVSSNQIVVLTPPAFGAGRDNLNRQVDVRVHDVTSGLDATLTGGFRYVQPVQLTALSGPNLQRADLPFTPVTIHGHGFQAPVAVTLAGWAATIISVSESELVVLPGRPLLTACSDISGTVSVTNINSGDTATGLSFTYLVAITRPSITDVTPRTGPPGTVITITGFNFPTTIQEAQVEIGSRLATVTSASSTELVVIAPDQGQTPPLCTGGNAPGTPQNVGASLNIVVTNRFTTCTTTLQNGFQYQLPCAAATPLPTNTPATPLPTVTPTPTFGPTPTPTPAPADLALTKADSPDPVVSGNTLTYTITANNNGPGASNNVVVTDPIPVGTTFIACTASQGTCSGPSVGTDGTVTGNFGTIGSPGFATLTIQVNVTAAAGVTFTNGAVVTSSTPDTNNANNTATASTTVSSSAQADVAVTKSDSPDPVTVGNDLTYTMTVTNNGPSTANDIVLSDSLPTGTTFVSCVSTVGVCSGPPVGSSGVATATIGSLPNLGTATVTLVVNVTAGAGSTITNAAEVTASTADSNLSNNTATSVTSVTTPTATDLSISKSDSPDPVLSGGMIAYTIVVSNLGPNSADNVQMSDPLPGGTTFFSCSIDLPATGTCTTPAVGSNGTVVVNLTGPMAASSSATIHISVGVSAPANSTLTNTASVLSSTPDSNSANNNASATTTVSP